MTPQERGHFVHAVFESFFAEWQRLGRGAITDRRTSREAIALFDTIAERHLAALPEGDRALERTLLLGSAAAAGFGERAFAFEIEDDVPVVERLLEYELEGHVHLRGAEAGPRRVDAALEGGSHRSARGRHAPHRRLQDRPRAGAEALAAAADLRRLRAAGARRAARALVDGLARRLHRVQGEGRRSRSCRMPAKALAEGQATLLTVVDAHRARRVPGPARRAVPLQLVPVSRRVPQGLRRRRDREMTDQLSLFDARDADGRGAGARRVAGSRHRGARVRARSRPQRRARGVGRHGQDERARHALREPADARRRSGEHPRDHVHAQGGGRDARAHHPRAAPRRRAVDVRSRALDRDPRSSRRHPDQHHRRVLPVAAARVPARGGSRSRLRHGGRDGSAAARRSVARQVAGHLHRPGEARARPGAGARAARADAHARRAGLPAAAAARRVGRARSLPRARPGGSRRRRRLPPRGRRARSICSAAWPGGLETFLAEGPVHQPRYQLLAQDLRRLESFRTARERHGPRTDEPRRARTC